MKNISDRLGRLFVLPIDNPNYIPQHYLFRTNVYTKTQEEIDNLLGQLPDWVQYEEL